MYQIKVTWSPELSPNTYKFATKNEAHSFQVAITEMTKILGHPITHDLIQPDQPILLILLSTFLVGFWTVAWWHFLIIYSPTAVIGPEYWQIGVCASSVYLLCSRIARWFES